MVLLGQIAGGSDACAESVAAESLSTGADLHTHYRGILPGDQLLRLSLDDGNVWYDRKILSAGAIGLSPSALIKQIDGKEMVRFVPESFVDGELAKLDSLLSLDKNTQSEFSLLERAYDFRQPLTKMDKHNPKLQKKILERIAALYSAAGTRYVEASISNEILDQEWINLLRAELPKLEEQYGLRIRFLVSLDRNRDPNELLKTIEKVEAHAADNPFVVGVDFLGEEINETKDFAWAIKRIKNTAKLPKSFQIRVHAGESPAFVNNVAQAVAAGATRIGHGVYGLNESVLEDAVKRGVIFELNPNANLRLGYISAVKDLPLNQLLEAGARVTIGSDGFGVYSGTLTKDQSLIASENRRLLLRATSSDELYIGRRVDFEAGKSCQRQFSGLSRH